MAVQDATLEKRFLEHCGCLYAPIPVAQIKSVRPFPDQPIYVEFVFNFLENFTGVATDAATRPNHGFLTPRNWKDALAASGFEAPAILPDVEELARHYDSFFVAAVSARRPPDP